MAINAYSWAKDGEKNLSPSFKVREFRCSDNTDPIFIDSELVEILQKIRNHFGKPVNIQRFQNRQQKCHNQECCEVLSASLRQGC